MSLSDSLKKLKEEALVKGKDIAEQGKSALDSAVEKGKGLAEQGKLNMENQKQAQIIAEAKQQIGAYVVENNLLADDEFVLGQLSVIAAAQEVQEANNARIGELKAGAEPPAPEASRHFCPQCGAPAPAGAAFCTACGAKL